MDVHVPAAITRGLLLRGVDVITAQLDGTTRLEDPEIHCSTAWWGFGAGQRLLGWMRRIRLLPTLTYNSLVDSDLRVNRFTSVSDFFVRGVA